MKNFVLGAMLLLSTTVGSEIMPSNLAHFHNLSVTQIGTPSATQCPYDQSKVYEKRLRGDNDGKDYYFEYYFKCRFVTGDPEWHMYMRVSPIFLGEGYKERHPDPRVKVFFERTTYGGYGGYRSVSTSAFPKWEMTLADGGNTSSQQPLINITKVEAY